MWRPCGAASALEIWISCGATHGQTAQVAETARSAAASRDTVVPCPENDFGWTKRNLNELGNSSLEDGDIRMEMIGHKALGRVVGVGDLGWFCWACRKAPPKAAGIPRSNASLL